jgi:hypothetical protein
LDNDLYDLGVGFTGFNTFNAHGGGNLPAGPLYFRLDSQYTATRSDADYYFKDFDTILNGGPFIPRPPEGMVATNAAEASASVLINASDFKSSTVTSVAVLAEGKFKQGWDDDQVTPDATAVNGKATVYFTFGPMAMKDVKKKAPLAFNFDLGWGASAYLGEWYLPSTCADTANPSAATCSTTDEFLGVPYDPTIYRGEEALEQMPHNDQSLVAKVSLGGSWGNFKHTFANTGLALVARPDIGFTYEIVGTSEQKLQPVVGATLSLEGAGIKLKR